MCIRDSFNEAHTIMMGNSLVPTHEQPPETTERRAVRRRRAPDESASREDEIVLTGRQKLRVDYFEILDNITDELQNRHLSYKNTADKFNFLFHLHDLEPNDVEEEAKKLLEHYEDHIDENFVMECVHYK